MPLDYACQSVRRWIQFDDADVEAITESTALEGSFQETDGSAQTACISPYLSNN
jgi:hypothetical protein